MHKNQGLGGEPESFFRLNIPNDTQRVGDSSKIYLAKFTKSWVEEEEMEAGG